MRRKLSFAIEKHLATNAHVRKGIGDLLAKYKISGYEESLDTLLKQLAAYDDFLKNEIVPKARPDFTLPPPVYALELERFGVDILPADLTTLATSEVARYTFRMPGQATSYFYGYTRMLELRRDVELKQKSAFAAQRFHDFVLAQGILPPNFCEMPS